MCLLPGNRVGALRAGGNPRGGHRDGDTQTPPPLGLGRAPAPPVSPHGPAACPPCRAPPSLPRTGQAPRCPPVPPSLPDARLQVRRWVHGSRAGGRSNTAGSAMGTPPPLPSPALPSLPPASSSRDADVRQPRRGTRSPELGSAPRSQGPVPQLLGAAPCSSAARQDWGWEIGHFGRCWDCSLPGVTPGVWPGEGLGPAVFGDLGPP